MHQERACLVGNARLTKHRAPPGPKFSQNFVLKSVKHLSPEALAVLAEPVRSPPARSRPARSPNRQASAFDLSWELGRQSTVTQRGLSQPSSAFGIRRASTPRE